MILDDTVKKTQEEKQEKVDADSLNMSQTTNVADNQEKESLASRQYKIQLGPNSQVQFQLKFVATVLI